jgi:hypothetical protein
MTNNSKYSYNKLAYIGASYPRNGRCPKSPQEKLLVSMSHTFSKDPTALSIVYALLDRDKEFYDPKKLIVEMKKSKDSLGMHILCGVLHKVDKNRYKEILEHFRKFKIEFNQKDLNLQSYLLSLHGQIDFDSSMEIFGVKMSKIEKADKKKLIPKDMLAKLNPRFKKD